MWILMQTTTKSGEQTSGSIKMKRLFFIFFIFLFSAALASAEETYGNSTYGNFSYGISSSASSSFTNSSVNIQNNTPTLINATDTNVTLELVTDKTTNGSVTIVKYNSKPTTVGTNTFTALNKYIDIVLDDSISDQLNYSIIKMFYTDAEVAAANLDESTLRLQKWNGTTWIQFDGPGVGGVETTDNYVWANTSSFSTWGVFGTSPQASQQANGGGGGGGESVVTESFVPVVIEESPTPRTAPPATVAQPEEESGTETLTSTEAPQQAGLAGITGRAIQNIREGKANTGIGISVVLVIVIAGLVVYSRRRKPAAPGE
jgi:hypothetical protein